MIREAQVGDIPQIVAFLSRCFDQMRFSRTGWTYHPPSVAQTMGNAISAGTVLVDDSDGIRGVFAFMVVPSFMDYRQSKAVEFVWHSDPNLNKTEGAKVFCRLLDHGSKLAADKGASTLHVSTSPLFPSASELLKRRGFVHAETHYSKRI